MLLQSFKKNPTTRITVGKQRLKQNGSVVYLKDGDEFEVEIFRPQDKIQISQNLKLTETTSVVVELY